MITTINQRLKQLWSNSNCLYLARNLSLRFAIKTLGNSKPNWSWQNLTVSIIFVFIHFLFRSQVIVSVLVLVLSYEKPIIFFDVQESNTDGGYAKR